MAGENHTIEIFAKNNRIDYSEEQCHVKRGDEITWTCADGPFAVQFLKDSPVTTLAARSQGKAPVKKAVGPAVRADTYSYACSVFVEKENQVYLDARCPAIIVDYP